MSVSKFFKKLNESLPLFNHLFFYHNCLFNYRCLWGNVAAYLWQYGRSFYNEKETKKYAGFTLLEMLIVLLIISVLILLFVPNLAKHKETVDKKRQ